MSRRLSYAWPFGRGRPILRSLQSGLGKSAIVYPVSAIHAIALGTISLGMVFYLRDFFDAEPAVVGLVSSIWSLAYFVGCFVFRPLTRLLLPRVSLLISVVISSTVISLILLARTVAVVGVLNALYGFGVSLFWPPIMGWLSTGLEGKQLGKALGRFNFAWSIGVIFSPLIAGVLSETNSRYPMYFGIACFVLVFVVAGVGSLLIPKIRRDRHREPVGSGRTTRDESSPLRFAAWISIFGAYIVVGIFNVVFPIHGRSILGLSESTIGSVLILRTITTAVSFAILGRITIWHHRPLPMIMAQVSLALICLLVALLEGIGIFIVVFPVIGMLAALSYSESVFHGVTGATHRARRMAIHESLLVAGQVLGAAGGASLYQLESARTMFFTAGAILLLLGIAQLVLVVVNKRYEIAPATRLK